MTLSNQQISSLLEALECTHESEINCEEFLDLLSLYAECSEEEIQQSAQLQKVSEHLKLCAECREEYDMLKCLLEQAKDEA